MLRMIEVRSVDKDIPFKLINVENINAIFPVKGGTRITYGTGAHVQTDMVYWRVKEIMEAKDAWQESFILKLYDEIS